MTLRNTSYEGFWAYNYFNAEPVQKVVKKYPVRSCADFEHKKSWLGFVLQVATNLRQCGPMKFLSVETVLENTVMFSSDANTRPNQPHSKIGTNPHMPG